VSPAYHFPTFKPKSWALGFHFSSFLHFVFPPKFFAYHRFCLPYRTTFPFLSTELRPPRPERQPPIRAQASFVFSVDGAPTCEPISLFDRRSAGHQDPSTATHRSTPPPSLSPFSYCKFSASLFS
jgi:hypothetical protein